MTIWDGVVVTPSDRAYEKVEKDSTSATDESMET